jgi:N-acetylmuramic acid 6-phosphate etherase
LARHAKLPRERGVPSTMSQTSNQRSAEFLELCGQFQLGMLPTESSHPVTANLSQTARRDAGAGLGLLFEADGDVVRRYEQFARSGQAREMAGAVLEALRKGGRVFFTGCGSTGRLSIQMVSIWRDFWQRQRARGLVCSPSAQELEARAQSVMAGGDFALIKSVEGFEDYSAFGRKQIGDLGVAAGDVVFAITEGGETSFVIGTAWKGIEAGARVYFVYNNPDELLCRHVQRSRQVIEEPRINKVNLTTGPMSITGSTRMQATTIQLCVLVTVLEMVLRDLLRELEPAGRCALEAEAVPEEFLEKLVEMHRTLQSGAVLSELAGAVLLEESVYRCGHKNSYFADRFAIDVLTDTTERSPTYCTPPFRKYDDPRAAESWSFLFLPCADTARAWERILRRPPRCVEWSRREVRDLVGEEKARRTWEVVRQINRAELMRFRVGLDGLPYRPLGRGDSAVAIVAEEERDWLLSANGFYRAQLEAAHQAGAGVGLIYFGGAESVAALERFGAGWTPECSAVLVPVPKSGFLLDGVTRAGLKMLLNGLSTCTMVRLGRVMGNYMIWVAPSNLKLIDRSTRYIQRLTGLGYAEANRLLFEVVEYVEPRMKADQAYPPVVGVAVMRHRHGLGNQEAEKRLMAEVGSGLLENRAPGVKPGAQPSNPAGAPRRPQDQRQSSPQTTAADDVSL